MQYHLHHILFVETVTSPPRSKWRGIRLYLLIFWWGGQGFGRECGLEDIVAAILSFENIVLPKITLLISNGTKIQTLVCFSFHNVMCFSGICMVEFGICNQVKEKLNTGQVWTKPYGNNLPGLSNDLKKPPSAYSKTWWRTRWLRTNRDFWMVLATKPHPEDGSPAQLRPFIIYHLPQKGVFI